MDIIYFLSSEFSEISVVKQYADEKSFFWGPILKYGQIGLKTMSDQENGGKKDEYGPFLEIRADFGRLEAKKSANGKA